MKIIFQGKVPEPILFNGKCSYCGTIVECVEDEIHIDQGERNYSQPKYFVYCPTNKCGKLINLQEGKYIASQSYL